MTTLGNMSSGDGASALGSYFEVSQDAVHSSHQNSLAGATEEGGLAMSPQQAACGSRRRANAHPATHGGRERQAVLGLQAEQKHRVRKTKGKAKEK